MADLLCICSTWAYMCYPSILWFLSTLTWSTSSQNNHKYIYAAHHFHRGFTYLELRAHYTFEHGKKSLIDTESRRTHRTYFWLHERWHHTQGVGVCVKSDSSGWQLQRMTDRRKRHANETVQPQIKQAYFPYWPEALNCFRSPGDTCLDQSANLEPDIIVYFQNNMT